MAGSTVVQWLALTPHSKKVHIDLGSAGCYCVEFACCICMGFLWVLQFPPTVKKHQFNLLFIYVMPITIQTFSRHASEVQSMTREQKLETVASKHSQTGKNFRVPVEVTQERHDLSCWFLSALSLLLFGSARGYSENFLDVLLTTNSSNLV